jgi:serine/threonine protein kinase
VDTVPTAEELRDRFPELSDQIDDDEIEAEVAGINDVSGDPLTPTTSVPSVLTSPFVSGTRDGECLQPGARLGRYRIRGVLGRGGMAVVYLAQDTELDRFVAVKLLHPNVVASLGDPEFLQNEARTAAKLEHPSFVPVHDFGRQDDGTCFFAMEYVEGDSLADLIEAGPMDHDLAVELTIQIAEALQSAHQQGFVHRDIKPANIIVDNRQCARITDFGLALHESVQQFRTGEFSGTLAYMAPEQVRGEVHLIDGRADIWALGAVFYEMLTGRRPFSGDNVDSFSEQILHREPKPPRQISDGIPVELERICLKCLSKNVTARYPAARDLAEDLRKWKRPRRRRLWLAAGFAMAATILLLILPFWPRPPLEGTVDVLVWNPDQSARQGLFLRDDHARPLRSGDQIRIQAELNRKAYIYIVWINGDGEVTPVYPWETATWSPNPHDKGAVDQVSLPEDAATAWPLQGPQGMETVVLLARRTPLPATVDLKQRLAELPRPPVQHSKTLVWFQDGKMVPANRDRLRQPQFYDPQRINDPLYDMHRHIYDRLNPYFEVICANSFAYEGESK